MKNQYLIIIAFCITLQLPSFAIKQQSDSLGMLGDNLDLYGVLELFKNADNTEEFEKALNSDKNKVNNLDLNNDGKVDYIKAIEYQEDNSRAITLQVDVNEKESQDVAFIEIDKTGAETATIQIIGDEYLYGKDYIVEPLDEKTSTSPATTRSETPANTTVVVNVWRWKPMKHYYRPQYVIWASPWHWGYYPVWYAPWTPFAWHIHRQHTLVYHHPYWHRVYVHRAPHIYAVYHPYRRTSKVVYTHRSNRAAINNDLRKNNVIRHENRSKFDQKQNRTIQRNNDPNQQKPEGGHNRNSSGKQGTRNGRR